MDDIKEIKTVEDFDKVWMVDTRHPLVNVMEGESVTSPIPHCRKRFGIYVIYLKDSICADALTYGRGKYDFQENTLVFVAPGQVLGHPADGSTFKAMGWCLYFSPELLRGTTLGKKIKDYTFFNYAINEALHISAQERETIVKCLRQIDDEIRNGKDRYSNAIIASAIELLLNYCVRFYERQFESRKVSNKDIVAAFEELVDNYYKSEQPRKNGTLTINHCADKLNLSPNYFGDLIKKETGQSPKDYIQSKIIETAKSMLCDTGKSISEISYALGYQYPQYFNRAFKNVTGVTPGEYRKTNTSTI